jgi:hypothetical protein
MTETVRRVLIIIGLGSIIALGGFYLGYKHASDVCNTKILQIETQAHISEIQALQIQLAKEQGYAQKIQDAQAESAQNVAEIEKKYQSAVSELNLINSNSVYSDRCSTDTATLPADTAAAAGTTATKSDRQRGQDIRRAKEDLLTIARDCDITASHYNELLKIYNSVRETNNQ